MTPVGENNIHYVRSGNMPSFDRIGTSTSGDWISIGHLNTKVVPTWPRFLLWLNCEQRCTRCILKFVMNMAPHSLLPYYALVVLRMQYSLPCDKGSAV
jgi:hypothetical protein